MRMPELPHPPNLREYGLTSGGFPIGKPVELC